MTTDQPGRKHIAITGATGFVGRRLLHRLQLAGHEVVEIGRTPSTPDAAFFKVDDIGADTDFGDVLTSCDAIVHLAARVHLMRDEAADPLAAFRSVNLHGTVNLAAQAAKAGIKRFVYASSIKVNGEHTSGQPYAESDVPSPQDSYGVSKWQAEQALHDIGRQSGMEIVIVRPPLVYGPGVKANFHRLLRLVEQGWPLPFAAVSNRRSMIYVDNLADALVDCVQHSAAVGRTYLVSDGEDVTTPELIRKLASAMGRQSRLVHVPVDWLRTLAGAIGKRDQIERLTQSLEINSTRIRNELDWQPPYTLQQGIDETVRWYLNSRDRKA